MTQEVSRGVLPELGTSLDDFNEAVTFDVRVLGWRSAGAGTVAALQEVFGLDIDTAQQLVSRVPAAVKRGVSAHEAQTFMQALQGVGAQVMLVRSGGPVTIDAPAPALSGTPAQSLGHESFPVSPPPTAAALPAIPRGPSRVPAAPSSHVPTPGSPAPTWRGSGSLVVSPRPDSQPMPGASRAPRPNSQPMPVTSRGPRPSPPKPRPVSQPIAIDHGGIDLIGNDGRSVSQGSGRKSPSGSMHGGPLFPDAEPGTGRIRHQGGQRELDFSASDGPQVRIDVEHVSPMQAAALPALVQMDAVPRFGAEAGSGRVAKPQVHEPEARPARKSGGGESKDASHKPTAQPAPTARAARMAPAKPSGPSKLVGVRQLLIGISVFVGGLLLDDSILRGDATLISVAAHGAGIYQLGLGLRRVFE